MTTFKVIEIRPYAGDSFPSEYSLRRSMKITDLDFEKAVNKKIRALEKKLGRCVSAFPFNHETSICTYVAALFSK